MFAPGSADTMDNAGVVLVVFENNRVLVVDGSDGNL